MRIRNLLSILGLILAAAIASPVLHADEINQATKVTFSQPVQIPGKTLPAGSYLIQLAGFATDREIVQIFDEQHELLATLFAIPRQKRNLDERAAFVLDSMAGPHDTCAIDVGFDTWIYPAYGPGWTRRVRFLAPRAGEVAIPDDANWVLIDFSDVVVHVFQEEARALYDIEGLWIDAGRVPVPDTDKAEGGPGADGGAARPYVD